MLKPVRTVAPSLVPVSVDEAKAQARVDHTDDDTLIGSLIDAAVSHLDGYAGTLGRCLINQSWRQDFCGWSTDLRLPFCDVSSVTLSYFDASNSEVTVTGSNYELLTDALGSFVRLKSAFTRPSLYDRSDPVRVVMVAGYGAAANTVPQGIRHAILMLVSHWYENREASGDSGELPFGVTALLSPFRRANL